MEDSRPSLASRLASYARKVIGSTPPPSRNETVVLCPARQMPAKVHVDSEEQILSSSRLAADANCDESDWYASRQHTPAATLVRTSMLATEPLCFGCWAKT